MASADVGGLVAKLKCSDWVSLDSATPTENIQQLLSRNEGLDVKMKRVDQLRIAKMCGGGNWWNWSGSHMTSRNQFMLSCWVISPLLLNKSWLRSFGSLP